MGHHHPYRTITQVGRQVRWLGRIRSARVLRLPPPQWRHDPKGGRPPRHGDEFTLGPAGSPPLRTGQANLATWPAPVIATGTDTTHHGTARAAAVRPAPRGSPTARRGSTTVTQCPYRGQADPFRSRTSARNREAKPVCCGFGHRRMGQDIDRCWQAFLRRFPVRRPALTPPAAARTSRRRPAWPGRRLVQSR